MCVSLVQDEAVESLVRTLAKHLASWGGVPLQCVFDRPNTIALEWQRNGEVTEWKPVFPYATLELGAGVELCWPYRAQQKGSVGNLMGFVKSSFFKVCWFQDEEDLRQQLQAWHREVDQERPCRHRGDSRAALGRREKSTAAFESTAGRAGSAHSRLCGSHRNGTARRPCILDASEAISMLATLYLYGQRVRIVASRYEAVHPRKFLAHEGPWLAEHRAALMAAVSGKRGKRYLKRQVLLELGELPRISDFVTPPTTKPATRVRGESKTYWFYRMSHNNIRSYLLTVNDRQ
jgi:hypothetical protein